MKENWSFVLQSRRWTDLPETGKEDPIIRAENLTFRYEDTIYRRAGKNSAGEPVIAGLDLTLYRGEAVALAGQNGAGKTTLGKLFAGILKPSSGRVILFGKNAEEMQLFEIGQKIGYCFQNPERQLFASTVEEEIGFGLIFRGRPKPEVDRITEELIKLFQLESVRGRFPLNLSYGEKKRLALAAGLALSPEYLILDEPTTGLDSRRIEILSRVLKELRSRNTGMLLISHNEEFLYENTTRILTMEGGRIVHDHRI